MPELREEGIRYMRPYFNMANHELMVDRIVEEFAWANVTREEAETAVKAAYAENEVFKHDVQMEGLKALAYMKEHDCRGIVLAGRPYHIDPEVNHGIPETICSLGMVVLSEDSICELQPGEKLNLSDFLAADEDDPRKKNADGFRHVEDRKVTKMPLRVTNQWAYHARLYSAANFVASYPGLELVQLNSFGCGLDAITTDQVGEILADKADVYTMLKIDEVSNLGAAKIRLRSLKAAVEERERNKQRGIAAVMPNKQDSASNKQGEFRKTGSEAPTPGRQVMLDTVMKANPKLTEAVKAASRRAAENGIGEAKKSAHNSATMSKYANRVPFGKDMKDYTIVAPQMSPIHFSLVESVIRSGGYKFDILKHASREDVETGLKYVNNDACYPSLIVVGQLMAAVMSGGYDMSRTAVLISQTGGGCRASNYIGFIRRALEKAGYPDVPVISINLSGLEKNPGFKLTLPLIQHGLYALEFGDIFMRCVYATRPYEAVAGSTDELHEKWKKEVIAFITQKKMLSHGKFKKMCREIIRDFDNLPRKDIKKPRVGVVGEILVKFHPAANNHLVELLESEGAEAVVPDLTDFLLYCFYNTGFKADNLGMSQKSKKIGRLGINFFEWLRSAARDEFTKSRHFTAPAHIDDLARYARDIVSEGNQTGEGWFLTGEMLELIHTGTPNIVCTQPFACLPNHVVGKGVIKELRHRYPGSNIVAIDYDPGASEVNQLNRIKLMLSTANKNLAKQNAPEQKDQAAG